MSLQHSKCLFILLFTISGYAGFSQLNNDRLITENFANQPISDVITSLQNDYGLFFFYKEEWLDGVIINVNLKDQNIDNALSTIFYNTELTYELLDGKTVILFLKNSDNDDSNKPIVTLNGKVSIANSDQAAANVTVFVDELKRGALTDDDGNYTIELPVGTYTLIFSSLTHLDERYNIRVTSGENIFNVEMFEKTLQLEDIVISAESIENNVSSTEVGKVVMTVNSIKKLPTFLGEVDISKIVKALPGVQSVGEGASGFNVRGGNIDQNLILMDGMPIFNSSHLLGFFSVYNPDLVSTFSLYKGSIPARFGGRISSVLEVNMKNPDDQNFSFQGGVGPVISKLSANIPIVKDKAALNVGTRFGYPTWIIQNFESNVNDNSADYYDINLKYQHKLSSNDVVNISGYISNDNFGFGPDSTFSYSTKAVSINWAHNFSNKLSSQVTAYMSDYEASLDDETENVESFLENGIKTWGGKIDFLYDLNNSLSFNAGIDFQNYEFNPGKRTPATSSSDVREIAIDQQKALESALFVDAEYNVSPRFSIAGGIRFSQFFNVGPASEVVFDPFRPRSNVSIIDTLNNSSGIYRTFTGFEPRLSGTLKLNAISSIKASYTRNFQYIYLFSNSTATLPTDVWRPSDNNIKPQQSDQWTLGYVRSLKDNTYQFSIDAFYKDVNQTAEVALGAEVLLNELLVSDIQSAEGRAYGAEILMRKAKGKVTGWLSYTLSRSERRLLSNLNESSVSGGEYFLSNFDRPHNLNVAFNWKASRLWTVASNFVYNSGRPVTLPSASFTFDGVRVFSITERNNFRIPDTHRLDLSVTLEGSNKRNRKWNHSFTFSVYNVYGRKNPFSVFFRAVNNTQPRTFRLAVLGNAFPSFTYNFKFQK